MDALGIKLLQRLSSSLISVEGLSTAERRNELRGFRRKVNLSLNVLKELGGCADWASASADTSPINRKRPKARARHTQLDPHPFDCMGIAVPMTEDEIHTVCGDILPQLRNILGVCASSPWSPQDANLVSALPPRPEATSSIGCIQKPTWRSGKHDDILSIHNSAD